MAPGGHDNSPPSTEPIPLQDLRTRRLHGDPHEDGAFESQGSGNIPSRNRSFSASIGRRLSLHHHTAPGYNRLDEEQRPQSEQSNQHLHLHHHNHRHHHNHLHPPAQHEHLAPTTTGIPESDLDVPSYPHVSGASLAAEMRRSVNGALGSNSGRGNWLPRQSSARVSAEGGADAAADSDDDPPASRWQVGSELETAPLADTANQQPMAGAEKRNSGKFAPGPSLGGDMLSVAEMGMADGEEVRSSTRSRSVRAGLAPTMSRSSSMQKEKAGRSLSVGAPVRRVSVALQNMGNRVINLGNDGITIDKTLRRGASSKSLAGSKAREDEGPDSAGAVAEKAAAAGDAASTHSAVADQRPWAEQANPLKGNSLRLFPPTNRVRLILCDVLIHP